jgi:hypothetical protein
MNVARELVEGIGIRWSGHGATRRAADYLAGAFADLGLQVERQDFPFVGWDVDEPPSLEVLAPEKATATVALMEYSGSTPVDGLVGELRPAGLAYVVAGFLEWPRYALITADGQVGAYLIVHIGLGGWDAPPIPLHNPDPMYPYPMAIVAEKDHRRFQAWLQEGKPVRVRFCSRGHIASPLAGHNVVATLPGTGNRKLVFTAHLDTAYGTPGANNNAGGVQAMFDLAKRLQGEGPHRLTYQFLACDCCEWNFLGSRYFVREEKAQQRLDRIVANINIDTVASGDSLFFLASTGDMRKRAVRVVETLRLGRRFRQVEYLPALAGSDHYSFIQAGVPASEILFWPCNAYKLPQDDMSQVDSRLIALSVDIAHSLAKTFEE